MPRGGVKCPDCGHRFRRVDFVKAESTKEERAYLCPGNGSKGFHELRMVKIMRVNRGTPQEFLKLKIFQSKSTIERWHDFEDALYEANKRKYRPDLIFK